MFLASIRPVLAATLAMVVGVVALAVFVGSSGSATASVQISSALGCLPQAKELTDASTAAQDSATKVTRAKKGLRSAKRSHRPARIRKARRQLRRATAELRLQLEWYTTARAAYETCMKASPTATSSPTSTPTSTSTSTATPTGGSGLPTTQPTTLPTTLPTLPPVCVPNPLPTGPREICLPV